jgi:hypothetical protein
VNEPQKNGMAGVLLAGFGVGIWLYTGAFPSLDGAHPGPALFPRVIAGGMVLLSCVFIIGSLRQGITGHRVEARRIDWMGVGRWGLGVMLVAAYPLLQRWVGFVPAVGLLCFVVAVALKARLITAAATALVGALVL